ncbi:unnamed protein product [Prunus armeniaca]|uniref:Uncharacterized protein n=1 Tax=Prunus armeniaca TaxID=36596 RepID=A0A6J5V536_PRUAR|nr:unnamed protein product [Prunus armeniaca]
MWEREGGWRGGERVREGKKGRQRRRKVRKVCWWGGWVWGGEWRVESGLRWWSWGRRKWVVAGWGSGVGGRERSKRNTEVKENS